VQAAPAPEPTVDEDLAAAFCDDPPAPAPGPHHDEWTDGEWGQLCWRIFRSPPNQLQRDLELLWERLRAANPRATVEAFAERLGVATSPKALLRHAVDADTGVLSPQPGSEEESYEDQRAREVTEDIQRYYPGIPLRHAQRLAREVKPQQWTVEVRKLRAIGECPPLREDVG